MAGINKKRQVFGDASVRSYLDSMSKAALADLVIDFARAAHGSDMDGDDLGNAIASAAEPVAMARGDKHVSYRAHVDRMELRKAKYADELSRWAEHHNRRKGAP